LAPSYIHLIEQRRQQIPPRHGVAPKPGIAHPAELYPSAPLSLVGELLPERLKPCPFKLVLRLIDVAPFEALPQSGDPGVDRNQALGVDGRGKAIGSDTLSKGSGLQALEPDE